MNIPHTSACHVLPLVWMERKCGNLHILRITDLVECFKIVCGLIHQDADSISTVPNLVSGK